MKRHKCSDRFGMNSQQDGFAMGATAIGYSDEKLPPQVLVVDDSKEIRDSLTIVLRAGGHGVIEAEDALAAQRILRNERPVLVITDLEMPVADGWELLEHCHEQHPGVPVLIISGAPLGQRPEVERWAAGFLLKPFSLSRFRTEVQRLVLRAA
jgi:DNA-binding NtrC family response regulator